ncbi:MAG: transposase family protein, partial [Acidobacteriota bacterium]|nr:transposase family protein [Acidobacteriota bacterium]
LSRLDRSTGKVIRYEKARPGELLHIDVKKLGRVPEGGGWKVHGRQMGKPRKKRGSGYDFLHVAVDDHSRFAYVATYGDERGETCAQFLAEATEFFAAHGITVEKVMTDNAKNYTRSRLFQAELRKRTHLVTRPYRPQTNGKAERFNRTMLDEWAYARPYRTNAERLAALRLWLEDYNWSRTHSAIGNRPPASRLPSTT